MDKSVETFLIHFVPTILFLGLAIPISMRLLRGVIPANKAEGVPVAIHRKESPGAYWRLMTLHLFFVAVLAASAVIAWCA